MTDKLNHYLKKWVALDIVKFVCVAAMIFVHAHIALVAESDRITNTLGFYYEITSRFMFIGLFLIALPIIAGSVLRINFGKHLVRGKLKDYKLSKIIWISVFISLLGFFMNITTWGVEYIFSWNVLQLIGLSFVVIAILLKVFSVHAVFLTGLITMFAVGPLRSFLGDLDYIYFINIFIGTGDYNTFWSFFPWFSVVAFGFLFAHYYLKYKDSVRFRISAFAIGIILVDIAIFRNEFSPYLDPEYVWGPSLSQPTIGWILASIGFFYILMVVANIFFNKIRLRKYGIINSYSKGILWIYIVQMFVSQKLSLPIKRIFPMDEPSYPYFILPIFIFLLSWLVGALSIKLLQEKRMVITLKKI